MKFRVEIPGFDSVGLTSGLEIDYEKSVCVPLPKEISWTIEADGDSAESALEEWYREGLQCASSASLMVFSFFMPDGGYWEGYPVKLHSNTLICSGKWYPPSKLRRPLLGVLAMRTQEQERSSWELPPGGPRPLDEHLVEEMLRELAKRSCDD